MKIGRKILSVLIALALTLTVMPFGVFDLTASALTEGYYTYTVSSGEVTITDVNTSISGSITIPSKLDGYPVTNIGYYAFYQCKRLTHVTIPYGVVTVGSYAFSGCSSLTSITIATSVSTIDFGAFYYCSSLKSISIPNSVRTIGDDAFYNCTSLSTIKISDDVTSIAGEAFYGTSFYNNQSNWKDGVLYIGNHLIRAKSTISGHYQVKSGTKTIAAEAFGSCSKITSITLPDGIKNIDDKSFMSCSNLNSINIPEGVTRIGYDAFFYCKALTSVKIPNTVKKICGWAFAGCSLLTSINIPYGVSSIDYSAFQDCTNLNNIKIPDSVTQIGRAAFYNTMYYNEESNWKNNILYIGNHLIEAKTTIAGDYQVKASTKSIAAESFINCSKLTSISLPEGITELNDSTFRGCVNLTTVKIPNSVKKIGRQAFAECRSLSSINIPIGVEFIERQAFEYCILLEFVTIPTSVKNIGDYAFCNCSKLISITIPDSVTIIGSEAFGGCHSSMIIYGSVGSYAEKFAKQNGFDFNIKGNAVYTINVVDTLGQPIKNANVVCNGVSKQTNSQGYATFEHRSDRKYSVTVKQFGYETYSRSAGDTSLDHFSVYSWETNSELIILKSKSEGKLGISNVFYQNNSVGLKVDIQHRQKIITKPSTGGLVDLDDGLFDIICNAEYSTAIAKYELWQGNNVSGKKIATSTTGKFKSLSAVSFNSGASITLYTYDASGHYHTTPLYLLVKDPEPIGSDESSISLGKKTEFQVPNSIPFVGGTTLTMDTLDLPIDVIVSDDTLHVGINTKFGVEKKSGESFTSIEKATFKSQINSIKNTISNLKKLDKTNIDKKTQDKVKNILKDKNGKILPGTTEGSVLFVGYGEVSYSPSNSASVKIELYAVGEFSYDKTWQTFVSVVPIVISIDVSGQIKASVEGTYNFGTNDLRGEFALYPSVALTAGAGVGVGKIIGSQAYGSAVLSSEIVLLSSKTSTGLKSVDITGELGFKAYLGAFEYNKVFAQHTWHLYPSKIKSTFKNTMMSSFDSEMYLNESYTFSDVSYLDNQSGWLASVNQRMLLRSYYTGNSQYKSMLTGTYRNAQPQSISNGKDAVMVFLSGNTQRDSYNLPQLMYSVYDSISNSWSEPIAVDTNDTSDQAPYLFTDGTDIYLTYCDSERIFNSSDEIEDYICSQSIAVSKFDSETKTFSEPTIVANSGGKYNSSPKIAIFNDIPTVVWQSNTSADVFGQNNTNTIMYSFLNDIEWSEEQLLVSGLNSVVGYSVGELDNKLYVSYIIDADNDLTTLTDRELFISDFNNNIKKVDDGEISNPLFTSIPGVEGKVLTYYNCGNLSYTQDGENIVDLKEEIPNFSDNYMVLSDRIVYLSADKDCTNIFNIIYDKNKNTWSEPVKVTTQDKYIGDLSAFEINNRLIYTMTQKNVTITEENVVDECDLGWILFNDYTDIAVNSVYYDYDEIIENGNIQIGVDLTNTGTNSVKDVNVIIKDENGNEVLNEIVNCELLTGDNKSVFVNPSIIEATSFKNLSVIVYPVNDGDINEADNLYEIKMGYTELSVLATSSYFGNNKFIEVAVSNNSHSISGGILEIYNGNQLIASENVSDLKYNETVYFKFELTDDMTDNNIFVNLISNVEDYYDYNNTCNLYICDSIELIPDLVKINSEDLSLRHKDTLQLSADVLSNSSVNFEYFWYSGNEKIVSVSEKGEIIAVLPGTTEIYVTTVNGGLCDSITVTVNPNVGDGNSDGLINAEDLIILRNAFLEDEGYNDVLDANGDDVMNVLDLVRLKKHLADDTVPLGKQNNALPNSETILEVATLPENKLIA